MPAPKETVSIRTMVAIVTAILVAAALYFAKSIFAPFTFALFIMAIVWPVQSALQNRLPEFLAVFLTLIATVMAVIAFGAMVAWAFSVVAEWIIGHAPRFQELYLEWVRWLEEHDILVIGSISEHFDAAWMVRMLQTLAGHVNRTVGFALLVFVFMMLALLETGDLHQKLATLGKRGEFREVRQAGAEIAAKFRKYMVVRTLLSALTGVAVWAFALFTGLELPIAWGIIAFALNYIPFIGSFAATVLPTLFALAQFDSWQSVAIVAAGLTAMQFFIGNYLEPRMAGAALAISPLAVIFAVFFWSFLWGIPGALIGVPITIALLTLCEHSDSTRWIATLLSGTPAPAVRAKK
jgi:predicted PurR-regulated permease PerM